MKSLVKIGSLSLIIASSFALAAPAMAGSVGYDSTISSPLTTAVRLDVRLSEDMQHRANNLPEKLSDRGSGNRLRSGFGNNGFYGEKDLNRLNEKISKKLEQGFSKKGIEISDNAPVTLVVTLQDAKPNRPTFEQLSREPSLSFKSVSIGGAELTGELVDAQGNVLGTMDYSWYENDIRDAAFGGTWSDANRAIGRFATHAAKDLSQ